MLTKEEHEIVEDTRNGVEGWPVPHVRYRVRGLIAIIDRLTTPAPKATTLDAWHPIATCSTTDMKEVALKLPDGAEIEGYFDGQRWLQIDGRYKRFEVHSSGKEPWVPPSENEVRGRFVKPLKAGIYPTHWKPLQADTSTPPAPKPPVPDYIQESYNSADRIAELASLRSPKPVEPQDETYYGANGRYVKDRRALDTQPGVVDFEDFDAAVGQATCDCEDGRMGDVETRALYEALARIGAFHRMPTREELIDGIRKHMWETEGVQYGRGTLESEVDAILKLIRGER